MATKSKELEDAICTSRSASFWLKGAIMVMRDRDPIDAYADAEVLLAYCKARAKELTTD